MSNVVPFSVIPLKATDRSSISVRRDQTYACPKCDHSITVHRLWDTALIYCDRLIETEFPFKKGWTTCGAEMRPVEAK